MTTDKTYHGDTRSRSIRGLAPTGKKIHFETVDDLMRSAQRQVSTDHWGVANLLSLAQQSLASRLPSMCDGQGD